MIRLTLLREGNRIAGFTCSGHANHGEHGNDIVCSAVSAITQTCVIGIQDVLKLPAAISVDETEGIRCELEAGTPEADADRAGLLFDTMYAGLRAVEELYPGTLKFVDREV